MQRALIVLTLLLSGLIAGFFFAFSADVNLATAELAAADYVHVQQLINLKVRNSAFAIVYFGAAVVPAILLAVTWRQGRTGWYLTAAAGYVLYLAAFFITREINVPINNELATWNPQQAPASWVLMWTRWNEANLIRTIISMASFACYAMAFSTAGNSHASKRNRLVSLSAA
ncbi:MAG TPA: anthrone oxygenase family protein [Noviherbaspirillum sp.]|nr:anthrone oxygenase family protein [Noviherbaspirillum sp.]